MKLDGTYRLEGLTREEWFALAGYLSGIRFAQAMHRHGPNPDEEFGPRDIADETEDS